MRGDGCHISWSKAFRLGVPKAWRLPSLRSELHQDGRLAKRILSGLGVLVLDIIRAGSALVEWRKDMTRSRAYRPGVKNDSETVVLRTVANANKPCKSRRNHETIYRP